MAKKKKQEMKTDESKAKKPKLTPEEQAQRDEEDAYIAGSERLLSRLGVDPSKPRDDEAGEFEELVPYEEQAPEPHAEEEVKEDGEGEEATPYGAYDEDAQDAWDPNYGRTGVVDEESIAEAKTIYEKYKQNLEDKKKTIVENEKWWQLKSWEIIGDTPGKENDPKPESAWMFNSLANKHADAMDNYPQPNLLPRERSDEAAAKSLSKIVPCILDGCNFEQTYSDAWWYKLKQGGCVYGIYWDSTKDNGAGDVTVKMIDVLNLLWEPGIKYIQDSPHLFLIDAIDNDILVGMYPDLEGQLSNSAGAEIIKYDNETDDSVANRTLVYDWYYKQTIEGKTIVQYCKFIDGHVLFASENCPEFVETGYYESGEYPFVVDNLFPVENNMLGFGYIDVMKSPQIYINKIDQIIAKNAGIAGKPRYAIKKGCGIDAKVVADYSQDVFEVEGKLDNEHIRQFKIDPLPGFVVNYMELKKDELKETSGNRDFSQGSTAAGVTAASAIAALQEAGSKLSRDMIKGAYRAYTQIVKQIVDLVRQFYDEPRCFRIDGEGGAYEFIDFDNSQIRQTALHDETGQPEIVKKPVFDIKISAAKQNAFNRASQNEMMKELYGMGVFNPQNATQALMLLEGMDFEGIEAIKKKVQENGDLTIKIDQLASAAMQIAQQMDMVTGANYTPMIQQILGIQPQGVDLRRYEGTRGVDRPTNMRAARIRDRAANQASVEGGGYDDSDADL